MDEGQSASVGRKSSEGWWVGGVFVGRQLKPGLFAEQVASRRHVIRWVRSIPDFAVRVGEVFGGEGDYQACTMKGDHVGLGASLTSAAEILVKREASASDTRA